VSPVRFIIAGDTLIRRGEVFAERQHEARGDSMVLY